MHQKLGIAGIPPTPCAVESMARGLNVSAVYLLDPTEDSSSLPAEALIVPLESQDDNILSTALRPLRLQGIWGATEHLGRNFGEIARQLGCPHLPCRTISSEGACPILGAQHYSVEELGRIVGRLDVPIDVPSWVRASCGHGDSSCMRVEHPSDVSLAVEKVRKRDPQAILRVQPAIDGTIYRALAFRTGADIIPFEVIEESMTSSVYRVSLGLSMPLPQHDPLRQDLLKRVQDLNGALPQGWGYVELEFVVTDSDTYLTDIQAPALFGEDLRKLVYLATGVDLLCASMECALGRVPTLTRNTDRGVALSWLLTRSGVVIGFEGVEEALRMPGVVEIQINAQAGHILSHVVDVPSRERGGYVIAEGNTADEAKAHLEAAREAIWINTSPALS